VRTLALKNHDKTRCDGTPVALINESGGIDWGAGVSFCFCFKNHDSPEDGQGGS